MNRKMTAYRKSRKFGDIHGGRQRLKPSSVRPSLPLCYVPGQAMPEYVTENTSKGFYFPLSAEEVRAEVQKLPHEGLTHVWLRRPNEEAFRNMVLPLGYYHTGRKLRAVVLYAWPKDRTFYFKHKPNVHSFARHYRCSAEGFHVTRRGRTWQMSATAETARHIFLYVLRHELGHHNDWRHFTPANVKPTEDFAHGFALRVMTRRLY